MDETWWNYVKSACSVKPMVNQIYCLIFFAFCYRSFCLEEPQTSPWRGQCRGALQWPFDVERTPLVDDFPREIMAFQHLSIALPMGYPTVAATLGIPLLIKWGCVAVSYHSSKTRSLSPPKFPSEQCPAFYWFLSKFCFFLLAFRKQWSESVIA